MRILVSGGAGFIGSHTVDALVARGGHEIAVIDDLSAGKRGQVNQAARVYQVDLREAPAVRGVIERERPRLQRIGAPSFAELHREEDVARDLADVQDLDQLRVPEGLHHLDLPTPREDR